MHWRATISRAVYANIGRAPGLPLCVSVCKKSGMRAGQFTGWVFSFAKSRFCKKRAGPGFMGEQHFLGAMPSPPSAGWASPCVCVCVCVCKQLQHAGRARCGPGGQFAKNSILQITCRARIHCRCATFPGRNATTGTVPGLPLCVCGGKKTRLAGRAL